MGLMPTEEIHGEVLICGLKFKQAENVLPQFEYNLRIEVATEIVHLSRVSIESYW